MDIEKLGKTWFSLRLKMEKEFEPEVAILAKGDENYQFCENTCSEWKDEVYRRILKGSMVDDPNRQVMLETLVIAEKTIYHAKIAAEYYYGISDWPLEKTLQEEKRSEEYLRTFSGPNQ
jgi:hypothetical protein